jgi:medium-chain acyl-[acyl-carrier-protein] hydrolase
MGDAQLVPEWLARGVCRFRRGGKPLVRLICFPSAGGAANMFRPWASRLPDVIEVVAIEFAGRGARTAEPLVRDLRQAAASLTSAIAGLGDRPFAFFGHSMGAMLAYELARQLRGRGREPVYAFLSACPAPHRIAERRRLHRLPDRELLAEIARQNGTPEAVLAEPELMALLLPIIRADLEMFETYDVEIREPLRCDVLALCGDTDSTVAEEEIRDWTAYAGAAFGLERFPGDHFFIKSAETLVLASVARRLLEFCADRSPAPSLQSRGE